MLNGLHLMTVSEYEEYLDRLREKVKEWKQEDTEKRYLMARLLGYITGNAGTGSERLYTETQLEEIFDLLN